MRRSTVLQTAPKPIAVALGDGLHQEDGYAASGLGYDQKSIPATSAHLKLTVQPMHAAIKDLQYLVLSKR